MNVFDKVCGVLAFCLGVVFLILGVLGVFVGCKAHFTLPPLLGILPAFIGWGIVRPIYVAWNTPRHTWTRFEDTDPEQLQSPQEE